MNRRDFLKTAGLATGGAAIAGGLSFGSPLSPEASSDFATKHLIWIINGNGSRKLDWYENSRLSPNFARLAKDSFVYTNSHNNTVSSHGNAWSEMLTGSADTVGTPRYGTLLHDLRATYGDAVSNYWFVNGVRQFRQWRYHPRFLDGALAASPTILTVADAFAADYDQLPRVYDPRIAEFIAATAKLRLSDFSLKHPPIPRDPFIADAVGLELIPHILREFKPRLLVYHQVGADTGHGNGGFWRDQASYLEYEQVCRTTDEQVGKLFDFVRSDPYFSRNTAIVVRPEFGRDDEVNRYGELHHSDGYYQTCRSAELWYGPDFKAGTSDRLVNRLDVAPSIARLFNVDARRPQGVVHAEMFKKSLENSDQHSPLANL